MPKPWKFPSLDSCHKRFLWTNKEVDLAPHPAVGLVLQVGDVKKLSHALNLESLHPSWRVSKQGHVSQPLRRMQVIRDFYILNLLSKLMVLLRKILFNLAIAAIAQEILIRISAEQVPCLYRAGPRYLKLVTFSNFWLFMLISAWTFWVLLVMILLFSMLLLIPLALALSSSLLVIS